jgi:hypothetical protein
VSALDLFQLLGWPGRARRARWLLCPIDVVGGDRFDALCCIAAPASSDDRDMVRTQPSAECELMNAITAAEPKWTPRVNQMHIGLSVKHGAVCCP